MSEFKGTPGPWFVKEFGIRYFLVDEADYGASDFADHLRDWNIEQLAERGRVKLCRLK